MKTEQVLQAPESAICFVDLANIDAMRVVAISGCLVIIHELCNLCKSHDDVSVRRQKQRISNASANPEPAMRHRGQG